MDALDEQIAQVTTELTNVRAAITTVMATGQSYSLDTGQTRTTVTRANLHELRELREELQNELAVLQSKKCGSGGSFNMTPGW